jgi:putative transposase
MQIHRVSGRGGIAEHVRLSDLPAEVRLAYWAREMDRLDVAPGTYDDAAHELYWQADSRSRARAERKAAIATMLTGLRSKGVKRKDRFALVRDRFGDKGTSSPSLSRLEEAVNGVEPINYAPALLDSYKATKARAELSDDAWRFFMTMIRDAAPDWPLKEAWRRVRDAGKEMGWAVPSYPTFYRRWNELDDAQRMHARFGTEETVKRQTIPARRDKTSILPLEWVSLDGRTQDFWVDWGDGKATRPVMLILADAASNVVLDWELAPSENANATVRVIKRVCERYGIFDNLYPDNGSSFAGHRVAGGNPHRFRNGIAKGVQPLGICKIMGINLHFALPKNAKAKILERVFATLSRTVDDGPEFKGAHAGHAPGASPSPDVVPVPVDVAKAVLGREIVRYNREVGRRSQGARGRSYDTMLRDGLAARDMDGKPLRRATADQLYLAGLHWKPATVDRNGQITVAGWTYGGYETRAKLAPFIKGGTKMRWMKPTRMACATSWTIRPWPQRTGPARGHPRGSSKR